MVNFNETVKTEIWRIILFFLLLSFWQCFFAQEKIAFIMVIATFFFSASLYSKYF